MIRNYLINLDGADARRAHMDAAFGRLGVAYERISAVDGHAVDLRTPAARAAFSAGEIGNFLSHRQVWDLIASRGDAYGAVFEDDIFLAPALSWFLSSGKWIPADADVVKIETMLMSVNVDRRATEVVAGFGLRRLLSTHWGVAGYIISAKAARTLSARKLAPDQPADHVLFDFDETRPGSLVVYQLDPALCVQHDVVAKGPRPSSPLGSLIQREREAMALRRRRKTPLSRIASELGKLTAMVARARQGQVIRKKVPFAGDSIPQRPLA